MQSQVLYVIPITSVLHRIPVVPVGKGIPFLRLSATHRRTVQLAAHDGISTPLPGLP
jgi:hypothetical protein